MKFLLSQVSAIVLALSAASAAYITPRQAVEEQQNQTDNSTQYPQDLNIGELNGTWFLTGITDNAWKAYEMISQQLNLELGCFQINITGESNTTLDVLANAFLNNTNADVGVNASAAGVLLLQQPDQNTNVSAYELLWNAYASQIFVNENQWNNFTNNGQNTESNDNSGSTIVPGSKPVQANIYTKLVDSTAEPGTNSTNFDTIVVWGSQFQTHDNYQKRAEEIYGIILSRDSSIDETKFNRTIEYLPEEFTTNNVSVVQLNDTCSPGESIEEAQPEQAQ
ncbi:MAG: hypothetical protein EXX96DRAFT_558424 [Benjaminiella poitrasii]|nr:MAG: hypothetical protein EXX96DRAFT_558424 [Benjaminiella poitrasii]